MKKVFEIEVDCAACALKCEEAIKKVEGVNNCNINFMLQKMTIEADNVDSVMKAVVKAAQRVEPDFEVAY